MMVEMMAMVGGDVDGHGLDIDDREIPGSEGDPPVTVRVYVPHRRAATPTPAILYIHGGGFFLGSIDRACRRAHPGP
jgi:acetyl esterase/lipase